MTKKLVSLLLVLGLAISAWAGEHRMKGSDLVPAATGKVQVEEDDNGNRKVKLEVKHLADPARLSPPKNAYVVWIQAPGKDAELLGKLKVNDDLEGELEAVTPYKTFNVFITAEESPTPERPSGPEVLRADLT